jgi:hypothetical protein
MNNLQLSTNESAPNNKFSSKSTSEHNDLTTNDTLNRMNSKLVPHQYLRINESTSNDRMFSHDAGYRNSSNMSSLVNSQISRLNTEREISFLIRNAHERGKSLAKELWRKQPSVQEGLFENNNSDRFMKHKFSPKRKFLPFFTNFSYKIWVISNMPLEKCKSKQRKILSLKITKDQKRSDLKIPQIIKNKSIYLESVQILDKPLFIPSITKIHAKKVHSNFK